jgi:hypothetical protein
MKLRILTCTFATSIYLLAAHTARAEELQFQSVAAPSGAQSAGGQTSQSGGSSVQTVELGDVTGTVCDCGEVTPAPGVAGNSAGRGFPKMALVAGAVLPGIPFFFMPSRRVPQTSSPVPEPLTLATLAAGLATLAALRKRRV